MTDLIQGTRAKPHSVYLNDHGATVLDEHGNNLPAYEKAFAFGEDGLPANQRVSRIVLKQAACICIQISPDDAMDYLQIDPYDPETMARRKTYQEGKRAYLRARRLEAKRMGNQGSGDDQI